MRTTTPVCSTTPRAFSLQTREVGVPLELAGCGDGEEGGGWDEYTSSLRPRLQTGWWLP